MDLFVKAEQKVHKSIKSLQSKDIWKSIKSIHTRDTMSKKFNKLKRKIDREYLKKGFSRKRAKYIAKATAAKVFREKEAIG